MSHDLHRLVREPGALDELARHLRRRGMLQEAVDADPAFGRRLARRWVSRGAEVVAVHPDGDRLLFCRSEVDWLDVLPDVLPWRVRGLVVQPLVTDRRLRLLACRVAEDVLPIWERDHPDDPRARHAIGAARRYALGEATREEMAAARDAAWGAAWTAAWTAAWGAARDAACGAAWTAARDAAWTAAWDATRDAARDAACGAAWTAAWDAAAKKYASWLVETMLDEDAL